MTELDKVDNGAREGDNRGPDRDDGGRTGDDGAHEDANAIALLQLKNKWDQLKKEWKLWKDLKKGAAGFGWNSKQKTIDASDEWWKGKIECFCIRSFPQPKKFRYSGIDPEMEEKLDKMFMSDENAWAPNSKSLPPVTTDEDHEDFEDCESTKSLSGDAKIVNELRQSYSGSTSAS
ncbi:hypothetical protein KFK09_009196 [Dendrobium nobile]|uniref:Myb/SANT-like domain-containing protein n=1 Tax=Dendrobium nobile TaxID=94219 RepID=A0A8T3BPR4_DENNO|nr:hypothetical protein KFK09_009196 [Dendrobium nobile]